MMNSFAGQWITFTRTKRGGRDPEPSTMLGDERTDQRCRGSLSRAKKLVATLRISMVILKLTVLAFEHTQLPRSIGGHPVTLPAIDPCLHHPAPQRLGGHAQPRGHRREAGPLRGVLLDMVNNQPDRLGPELLVV